MFDKIKLLMETSLNTSSTLSENPNAHPDIFHAIIRNYFVIQDTTAGKNDLDYIFRYRGKFTTANIEQAYDQISDKLRPYNITPLFREEENLQVIYLLDGVQRAIQFKTRTNLLLFILTLVSVWVTGGLYALGADFEGFTLESFQAILVEGWPFAISIIAILGAHEMGHYFMGRKHKVNVSLPYFIPLPIISPFGTMGAFINMKSVPKNQKQLFDIGVAGPLAGLIVAVPVLLIGLVLSEVQPLPTILPEGVGFQIEGNSILYLFSKYLVFGSLLPHPASYGEITPFLYWIKYFFTGRPLPLGGFDVMLHQVAWAGWAGILVTALNLIPVGQLDGGHILNALLGGKNAKKIVPLIIGLMVLLGFAWSGWWLWAAIIFFMSRVPAQPLDTITKIDRKRKLLALLMIIIFILVFTPVPIMVIF